MCQFLAVFKNHRENFVFEKNYVTKIWYKTDLSQSRLCKPIFLVLVIKHNKVLLIFQFIKILHYNIFLPLSNI